MAQSTEFSYNRVAVLYCKGCCQSLCLNCRQLIHDKVQLFKNHEVVNIERVGNLAFRPHPVCATHRKTFLYYCSRCECLTCEDSMTSNHNEHKTEKINNVADARRENVNQIIEQLETKVLIVDKKLATIKTHEDQITDDCTLYVKSVEKTTRELHSIIDRHKLISFTTASNFQYFENQILNGKKVFFKRHYNETTDRLLKFKNLFLEKHDSTFFTEWKALQTEVQLINEETDDPLVDPSAIEIFNQEVFTKSVIDEIDEQFPLRLSGQLKAKEDKITELSDENENLKSEIKQRKHKEPNILIALFGARGSGKSSLGNTLIGKNVFEAKACGESVLYQSYQKAETLLSSGKILQVVDTPGITSLEDKTLMKEIKKLIAYLYLGPHAFILVLNRPRATHQEMKALKVLINVLRHDSILQNAFIIMVRRNEIRNKDFTLIDIHDFIEHCSSREVKELYHLCGRRIIAVENCERDEHIREKYRKEVLDMVMNCMGIY